MNKIGIKFDKIMTRTLTPVVRNMARNAITLNIARASAFCTGALFNSLGYRSWDAKSSLREAAESKGLAKYEDLHSYYIKNPMLSQVADMLGTPSLKNISVGKLKIYGALSVLTIMQLYPESTKNLALWPLREAAYKICSNSDGAKYQYYRDIFKGLTSKDGVYTGLYKSCTDGPSDEVSCSMPAPNILRIYLCLDSNTLPKSEYKPQKISDKPDQIYYSIKPWSKIMGFKEKYGKQNYIWPTEFLHELLQLKTGEITYLNGKRYYQLDAFRPHSPFISVIDLASYLLSFGKDGKGIYLSICDIWDFKIDAGFYNEKDPGFYNDKNGNSTTNLVSPFLAKTEPMLMSAIGEPVYIYDRYYLKENDINAELQRRENEDTSSVK